MTIPRIATYRLQFRNGMTFDEAADTIPYLKRLGISHLYASPVFTATSGSTHGYDIVDYNQFDPVLGGEAGFERLHGVLRDAGMGLIIDIVPNHMAASLENRWWRSVIEFGKSSPYAQHFDIDWNRRLTLPILGQDFRPALDAGAFRLEADRKNGCLSLVYFDHRLPINPQSYRLIAERLGERGRGLHGLADIGVPDRTSTFHDAVKTCLASDSAMHLDDALAELSKDTSFIDRLHADQSWRLTFWKEARRDLTYRRFFEVTGLVGVRVEESDVFNDVHRLVLALVNAGMVDGIRIDHVDGLARPTSYLQRLRRKTGPRIWILVEKILGEGEKLPVEWQECATTGYEFIPAVAQLLVDPEGHLAMKRHYGQFIGNQIDELGELRDAKRLLLTRNFEGELSSLVSAALGMARRSTDLEMDEARIAAAITDIIISFDVYRTYGDSGELSAQDRAVYERAALQQEQVDPAAVAFILGLLESNQRDPHLREDASRFRLKFQQLTGPVMAKAVEDTVFYRMNALIALNEVGCPPIPKIHGAQAFHRAMQARVPCRLGLVATSTHDTKRGEDARARLYALAERADEWAASVRRWSSLNSELKPASSPPEPAVEWLIYQALVGIWPAGSILSDAKGLDRLRERFLPYLEKALREAKLRTDWLDIDEGYENAVKAFVTRLLDPRNRIFLDDFDRTLRPYIMAGAINSISQTLAKLTAPGVPDIYQGSEELDFSLVDPDNRRPPDFPTLSAMLKSGAVEGDLTDGRFKQWMIARALACRSHYHPLFLEGDYWPLEIDGPLALHHPAYIREHNGQFAIVVLQRLPLRRQDVDPGQDRSALGLPPRCIGRRFRNILTDGALDAGAYVPLASVVAGLPVALLVSAAG